MYAGEFRNTISLPLYNKSTTTLQDNKVTIHIQSSYHLIISIQTDTTIMVII